MLHVIAKWAGSVASGLLLLIVVLLALWLAGRI
jgi:hypothetical protein